MFLFFTSVYIFLYIFHCEIVILEELVSKIFWFLKDILNLIPAKLTWGAPTAKFNTRKIYLEGATAKFNTRETYLEGATAKFNTRETQKFRGFLVPRNLVPAKFSTFKVLHNGIFINFELEKRTAVLDLYESSSIINFHA